MQVTVKFNDTLSKTIDLDFAWELFYLYQKGAKLAGEKITVERQAKWTIVEEKLQNAQEGDIIDFTLMGDIYYNEDTLNDNID